jgi:hypothetical protein
MAYIPRQFSDLPYMQNLPSQERLWLKKFVFGFYGPRTNLLLDLCVTSSTNKIKGENMFKVMKREAIESDNAQRRDIATRGRKVFEPIKEGHYRCLECLKEPCECEKGVYQVGYHTDDYMGAETNEDSVLDLVDSKDALNKKGTKFTSYGDETAQLVVGDRVEICMHTHVWQGRTATIVGESHGRWVLAIDGRDTRMVVRTRDLKKVEV